MMRAAGTLCGVSLLVLLGVRPVAPTVWAGSVSPVLPVASAPDCKSLDNAAASFAPRAYTLTSMYVRAKAPEYSFVKGNWVLGETQGILPPNSCLDILKREEIGVIQIWFWVRYLDAARQIRTGWVWGGTKNKDEGSYVGGDTAPHATSRHFPDTPPVTDPLALLASAAYAQGDTLPPPATARDESEVALPKPPVVDMDYLVALPILNFQMTVGTISALVLFAVMLMGMMAKAVWDQIDTDGMLQPTRGRIVRPLLVSPIAFSAFWGPMYVQQGGGGLSLTMALYAFQIGFMWQHVLEKKAPGGGKG
ncbi:MAG: hypothetical protein P0111_08045 [Nitrospira sp.]|nr:hypothetical protein [Nitrospira sp.]